MKSQVSVNLDKKTREKLCQKAQTKEMRLSEYLRRLVEIGMRVEEAAENNSHQKVDEINKISELGELKKLWKNELSWTLETKFLVRILVEKLLQSESNENLELMRKALAKSKDYVDGLFQGLDDGR